MDKNLHTFTGETKQDLETIRETVDKNLHTFTGETKQDLENIRVTVDKNLRAMQEDNNKKLDDMRQIVDEKLQKTLSERMNESFKLVNERLEQVYKGLGEMQTLAQGVGDLKKVLTNVKTRGIVGEIQLGAILEDILAPEQYETNVATVPNSRNVVEYAVKLPVEDGSFVWLPIDSKFPGDTYGALRDAYEGNGERGLRIGIHEQHMLAFSHKTDAQIFAGRRFAGAALLIGDGNDRCGHIYAPPLPENLSRVSGLRRNTFSFGFVFFDALNCIIKSL